jgi:gamma-glutamylcyclotransferase (GGCT)/AIG2-like uncharacterized protein YtfP
MKKDLKDLELIFVYGLFRDSGNSLLKGSEHIGKSSVNGKLYYVNEFYPGFVRGDDGLTWGDIYLIPNEIIPSLDEYEGDEYNRNRIKTSSGLTCWIYEYKHSVDGLPEITNGDWMLRGIKKIDN